MGVSIAHVKSIGGHFFWTEFGEITYDIPSREFSFPSALWCFWIFVHPSFSASFIATWKEH